MISCDQEELGAGTTRLPQNPVEASGEDSTGSLAPCESTSRILRSKTSGQLEMYKNSSDMFVAEDKGDILLEPAWFCLSSRGDL